MQDDTQKRSMDLKTTIVLDETELLEFVHEEIDARTRCADHLGKRFLRDGGQYCVRRIVFAVTGEQ